MKVWGRPFFHNNPLPLFFQDMNSFFSKPPPFEPVRTGPNGPPPPLKPKIRPGTRLKVAVGPAGGKLRRHRFFHRPFLESFENQPTNTALSGQADHCFLIGAGRPNIR